VKTETIVGIERATRKRERDKERGKKVEEKTSRRIVKRGDAIMSHKNTVALILIRSGSGVFTRWVWPIWEEEVCSVELRPG
jgi:hypothetical protein